MIPVTPSMAKKASEAALALGDRKPWAVTALTRADRKAHKQALRVTTVPTTGTEEDFYARIVAIVMGVE